MNNNANIDSKTVEGFADEWKRFDQSSLSPQEHKEIFDKYFSIFPWEQLPENAEGFDLGCGSGRWAKLVAPRVGRLHCIDPSNALEVSRKNLADQKNCELHSASVDAIPLSDDSMDFGYSLGVLHHVPDTEAGLRSCVKKLKVGAPFLVYLYYSFDNRPLWYRFLWSLSNTFRFLVSRLPHGLRYFLSQVIACLVYFPLARFALVAERLGANVGNVPLSMYRNLSFYTMRTDALDRFGTRLEQRFSREEIKNIMEKSGLEKVTFSSEEPFWCAIGFRRNSHGSC